MTLNNTHFWTFKTAIKILVFSVILLTISDIAIRIILPNKYGSLLFYVLSGILLGLVSVIFAKIKYKQILIPTGIMRTNKRYYLSAILIGISLFLAFQYILKFEGTKLSTSNLHTSYISCILLTKMLLGPISEEIYYRGVLFQSLLDDNGLIIALLVSSIIFAIMHIFPISSFTILYFLTKIIAGLIFALLYYYSRSLLPSLLCHVTINILSNVPVYIH